MEYCVCQKPAMVGTAVSRACASSDLIPVAAVATGFRTFPIRKFARACAPPEQAIAWPQKTTVIIRIVFVIVVSPLIHRDSGGLDGALQVRVHLAIHVD